MTPPPCRPPCLYESIFLSRFPRCCYGPFSIPRWRLCCVFSRHDVHWVCGLPVLPVCVLGLNSLVSACASSSSSHDDIKEMLRVHFRGYRFTKRKREKKKNCLHFALWTCVLANFERVFVVCVCVCESECVCIRGCAGFNYVWPFDSLGFFLFILYSCIKGALIQPGCVRMADCTTDNNRDLYILGGI